MENRQHGNTAATTKQHSTCNDVTNTWEKVGNHQLYEVRTGHEGPARMRTDNCRSASQAAEEHQNDTLWLS
jgi:hypothetical protein